MLSIIGLHWAPVNVMALLLMSTITSALTCSVLWYSALHTRPYRQLVLRQELTRALNDTAVAQDLRRIREAAEIIEAAERDRHATEALRP